jgi:hypothetical protein
MRSLMAALAILSLSCAPVIAGETRTYFGFSVGISNAPPPPRLAFVREPEVIVVPGTSVYVLQDSPYDAFRLGGYWYVCDDGYWYRATRYSGPFVSVDVRRVPRTVLTVPARHWKHHPHGGPPGQMKKHGRGRY